MILNPSTTIILPVLFGLILFFAYSPQKGQHRFSLQDLSSFCGTLSLEKQLKAKLISQIDIGEVLIKGDSRGHSMIVVDKAINAKGDVVFMLAQSYMPAQDIHIVKNAIAPNFGPWYPLVPEKPILTPQWIFKPNQLKTW